MTILNVDDRSENRYLFETILRAAGHEVVSAADGAEALAMLRQRPYDLVVSDVVMPGMDGFQFCREVKGDPATRDIPFVFFTAVYTEPKDEQFALSLGAVRFLVKPLEPDQLVAEIESAAGAAAPGPAPLVADTAGFLSEYNQRLIQKLETKLAEIERLNARLEASEARLRSIVEGTSDAITVKDHSGHYELINTAGARFLGRPAAEIRGLTDRDLLPPDTAAARAEAERRLMVFGTLETADEELLLPGEAAPRHFHTVRGPLRDTAGHVAGTFSISRDITERRRAEHAIRLLSLVVEQAPLSIVITDAEGNVEYVNPYFTVATGFSAAEVLGQNPRMLKSGSQSLEFYAGLWKTIKDGHEWRGVFENRRKSGERFSEQTVIAPVKDPVGKVTHFVAIKEDISERLRLEEQLRQSQKMDAIGRLAGGVAHDFNNLLTIIQLEASTLSSIPGLPAEAAEGIAQINAATTRATTLTRQLLAFSRHQKKQEQTVHLGELVDNLTKLLRRILGENIELATRNDPTPVVVRADPGMIEQALLNLAVNARDAMPGGGRLDVKVDMALIDTAYVDHHPGASPGYRAHIQVSDTGTGIAPEHLARVFEPFFTTKAAGQGTGLGLATVYGVIKQHHGWVTIDSEVGRGTSFHLFLPAISPNELEAGDEMPAPPLPLGRESVLMVEDDDQIRHLLEVALERQGYRVRAAHDAPAALAILAEGRFRPDLLLTDLVMPGGLNGVELATRVQATLPGIRILYMSGYPTDVVGQYLKRASQRNFIHKPFSVRGVLEAVRKRLDAQ